MTNRTPFLDWPGVLVAVAVLLGAAPGMGDTITIEGAMYKDVLVYKSSTIYYVKLPKEGRVISAPFSEVNESTVKINDDPYYRDELMALYDETRMRGESANRGSNRVEPTDPAFRVSADTKIGSPGQGSLTIGGPQVKGGMGIARSQVEQMMGQMGMQFRPGPEKNGHPTVVAKMPDGTSIQLIGPPNMLMGMVVKVTAPKAKIQQQFRQMQMMMGNTNQAEAKEFLDSLMANGRYETTQDGNHVLATLTDSGENQILEISVMAP